MQSILRKGMKNAGLEIDIPVDGNPMSAQAKENHFATKHLC